MGSNREKVLFKVQETFVLVQKATYEVVGVWVLEDFCLLFDLEDMCHFTGSFI